MNRTLKRVLGLAGSVAVGLVGAVTFASAAQAHHTTVSASTDCDENSWTVTWTVTDWDWKAYPNYKDLGAGVITALTPSNPEVELDGDIAVGDALPYPGEGALTATQTFSNNVASASLIVDAVWPNGAPGTGKGDITRPTEGCETPEVPRAEPETAAVPDCFGLTVAAVNSGDKLAEITFTPSTGDPVTDTPETDVEFIEYFEVEDPEAGLTVTVTADGEEIAVHVWDASDFNCDWGLPQNTCDGIVFDLAIDADAPETTIIFTTSDSDEEIVVDLVPGAEPKTQVFDAMSDELTVYLLIQDGRKFPQPGQVTWEKPADCDETPVDVPSEEATTPVAEQQLPRTGSSMTIMVSAAAALVVAAAVLFFLARRRKAAASW